MKKLFTLLMAACALQGQAQTLMVNDFENGDGGAYVAVDGTCEVFDNPATDGLNNSAKALKITSTNFAQVGFPVDLPDGKTLNDYTGVRFQALVLPGNENVDWIGFNVGVSQDKETMDLIDPTAGNGAAWGDCVENTWVDVELTFNEELLAGLLAQYTSGEYNVMIKLGRAEFVYAVDNIRLVEKEQLEDPNTIFTFETMDLGPSVRCGMPWAGSCEVIENPYTSGVNASQKCLEVVNPECSPVTFTTALPEGKKWSDYEGMTFDLCVTEGADVAWAAIEWGVRSDDGEHHKFGGAYDETGAETAAYGDVTMNEWMKDVKVALNQTLYSADYETVPTLYIRLMKSNMTYLIDNIKLVPAGASGIEAAEPVSMNKIYGVEGAVVVEAANAQTVNVYAVDGRMVYSQSVEEGATSISLEPGIYIVNGVKVVVY